MALSTRDALDQLKTLQKAEEDRMARQGNGAPTTAFSKDVKNSLQFQYDWSELLSAAPICISLMGACYVASASSNVASISLRDTKPADGFKKIQRPELRSCMIQVPDAGRFAFIEAEKKMDLIARTCQSLTQYLSKTLSAVVQLPDRRAEMELGDNFEALGDSSERCMRYAQDIEGKFQDWLELACEVYQVVVAKDEKRTTASNISEIEIGGVSIAVEFTGKPSKDAEEAAKIMKQSMDGSLEMFKKLADVISPSLEAIGTQLVASFGQATTSAVSQGLPVMLSRSSGKRDGGKSKTLGQANTNITDADDPAYHVADQARLAIAVLMVFLGIGTKNDVDLGNKGGLAFVETILNFIQNNTQWSQSAASTSLKAAIAQLLEVTRAIKLEASSSSGGRAAASSPLVQDWQKKTSDAKASVLSLVSTTYAMPGAAPGTAPLIGARPRASGSDDVLGANSALQSAQEKSSLVIAACTSAQTNYAKSVETRDKVQTDIVRIKTNLQSLSLQNAGLEQGKQVLRQLIGSIIQMKAQINNLVLFFNALLAIAKYVLQEKVRNLMQQAETARNTSISGVSLLDVMRSDLVTIVLMTQSYVSTFQAIPNMYKELSQQWIQPGISMLDQMGRMIGEQRQLERFSGQVNEFTSSSLDDLREKAQQLQERTKDTLRERTDGASQVASRLPALTPAIKTAIEDGARRITQAVEDGFAANQNGVVAAAN